MNSNLIKVSIICNTYNQEKYIRKALSSFVEQKTSFDFEILVHDDASTDLTPQIIKEFEMMYPNLVFPLYQTENQYSKGISVLKTYQIPRARGEYIALCEGDDYWTDDSKLEKQYQIMHTHPDIDICAHSAWKVDESGNKIIGEIAPREDDCIINTEDVIWGDGGFVATNSLLIRKSFFHNPYSSYKLMALDYAIQVLGSVRGGMYYLHNFMSAYRYMADGSWTRSIVNDRQKRKIIFERKQNFLDLLNTDTEGLFDEVIQKKKLKNEFYYLGDIGNERAMVADKYRLFFRELPKTLRLKIIIKALFPKTMRFWRSIKNIDR